IPLVSAEEAVTRAMAMPGLNLIGLHFHIGSLIFEMEPYQQAIEVTIDFAAKMREKHGFELKELNVGGGVAIQYSLDSPALPVSTYAETIVAKIKSQCSKSGLPLPRLVVEPGRSIVGRAGVALYTAGVVKDIPGIRRYVSVDGGMADNIRPALYGSKQEAVIANKMREEDTEKVTISGKFCESGDILISDIILPPVSAGDIIAVPDCGAYCLPEAMNYNGSFKPAVVLAGGGKARLIRRRETLEDLIRTDLV
ncbi:MAG: diaminopimelate decarboxylase, partial [Dehalococcoidales bacterium]|nr:diaminopimelate decarboxylase [Dehalococcoidales bacterium]